MSLFTTAAVSISFGLIYAVLTHKLYGRKFPIPLWMILLAWCSEISLGIMRKFLGCQNFFGDCYGTPYDGDIAIINTINGFLILASLLVIIVRLVQISVRKLHQKKLSDRL